MIKQAARMGRDHRYLIAILLAGLLIRAVASIAFWGPIESEGAEYSRIAENLRLGNGYSGTTPGSQLIFPPLFPCLILLFSLVTGDQLVAGRTLVAIFGAAMALPAYLIATRLYDRRTGLIAAAIVAAHPLFVRLSTAVFVETLYLAFLLASLFVGMYALEKPRPGAFAGMGLLFGLAYLLRPEGFISMLAVASIGGAHLIWTRSLDWRRLLLCLGAMIAAFALVAGPYIVWLSAETNQFRLEGKAAPNLLIGLNDRLGVPRALIQYGVDGSLQETGIWNRPLIETVRPFTITARKFLSHLAAETPSRIAAIRWALVGDAGLGSPALLALAMIGLISRPRSRAQAMQQCQALVLIPLSFLGLYFISYMESRFFTLFVGLFSIWAAFGLQRLGAWASAGASALRLGPRSRSAASVLAVSAAVLAIILPAAVVNVEALDRARAKRPMIAAGEWLASDADGPVRLAGVDIILSFHSNAVHFWLPYCDGRAALRYLEKKRVDYVVLRTSMLDRAPYLSDWFENGLPDPRARAVYDADLGEGDRLRIHRIDW